MKSIKINLKKQFTLVWIALALLLLINIVITIKPYTKYKKGQSLAIATMLLATDEFDEYKNNKKECAKKMYEYFNRKSYRVYLPKYGYIDNSKAGEYIGEAEESLKKILEGAGYKVGYKASSYFEFTNFFPYYYDQHRTFVIFYIILISIVLLMNIAYILSRKVEINVNENKIIHKKYNGKNKQFMIKDITSAETTFLKGLKITGNGIKAKTLLLKNNEQLKDYIINLLPNITQSNLSTADELKKYKKLLDEEAITEEEYENKKKELLSIKV